MNTKTPERQIPEGYMEDARGALIPVENIKDIDRLRDDLVREITRDAKQIRDVLKQHKAKMFLDIEAFIALSAEKYGVSMGGKKGNVTLMSFDGRLKVVRAIQESIVFDERLQVAKALVDECLHRWTNDANPNLRAIVDHAFQVDKAGTINTRRVLDLRKLKIEDAQWKAAMDAISDALSVVGSKSYVRVYERIGDEEEHRAIALDIASL